MRILISNDDGIQAKGLESLVKAFCARKHTVVVSAPARQQSGMAHALNVGRPLELIRGEALAEKYGIEAWAVDGTPTDSVKLYLEALAEEKPDVVVSGINHGANLATDILYSGTVGAAMEGMLHDISSFAVSLDVASTISYDEAAEEFALILERVMAGQPMSRALYSGTSTSRAPMRSARTAARRSSLAARASATIRTPSLGRSARTGASSTRLPARSSTRTRASRRTSTPSSRATSL